MKLGGSIGFVAATLWLALTPALTHGGKVWSSRPARLAANVAAAQTSPQPPAATPAAIPGLPKSEHVEPQRGKT
jgi:hypothetical protein